MLEIGVTFMSKVKIDVTIESPFETLHFTTNAIQKKEVLEYFEPSKTKVKLDRKENILIRENEDMKMVFYFKEEAKNSLTLRKYKRLVTLPMKTKKIIQKENYYHVEYEQTEEKTIFTYTIKIVEGMNV